MTIPKKYLILLLVPVIFTIGLTVFILYRVITPIARYVPLAKTKVGNFQGTIAPDGDYYMYLGIPYAQVNSSNVFGSAIPQPKFENRYIADNDAAICPQLDRLNKTVIGTLDCLRLNIYAPKDATASNRHPVLVFIHGGEYKTGHGRKHLYGPKYLMKQDIVVVTLNYRLGPYGFICGNIKELSGNQGFKDQILALQWIKANIVSFGGDPANVTIAGVGSGGESVNLHLLYNRHKLFQKAIIESSMNDRKEEDKGSAVLKLAKEFNFKPDNELDALKFLNKQNVTTLIAKSENLNLNYGACIEKEFNGTEAFISRTTRENIANVNIPVIIGHSNKESLWVLAQLNFGLPENKDLFNKEIKQNFNFKGEQLKKIVDHVRNFYIGGEQVGEKVKDKIVDFTSDLYHNYPTKRLIDKYSENGSMSIYYSIFSYSGGRNFIKNVFNISTDEATRGDVLGYLFDIAGLKAPTTEDQRVIDYMTTLWANFAKYGNPTPQKTKLISVSWEPVTKGKLNYLEITSVLKSKITPSSARTAFWDLFYKLNGMQERNTKRVAPWRQDKSTKVSVSVSV